MAEYIDKDKIPWTKVDNPKGIFWERIVFESAINNITPADVIERSEYGKMVESFKAMVEIKNENLIAMRDKYYTLEKEYAELKVKVDKAIEEIRNLRQQYPNENYYDCKWEILEILKRNIGE